MSQRVLDDLKRLYNPLTQQEAPHLYETLGNLSKKAGVADVELHMLKPGVKNPIYTTLIGALEASERKIIILGDEALRILGMGNASSQVTKEMEGVLAHELGHLKNKDLTRLTGVKLANKAPLIGMAAAIGALACVRYYNQQKAKGKPTHGTGDPSMDLAITNEKGELHIPPQNQQSTPWDTAATIAKYTAAAALGLGAGIYGSRAIRHSMEYGADKFSADLLQDGKPLASALRKFGEYFKQHEDSMIRDMVGSSVSEEKLQRIKKINELAKSMLHPNIDKRISTLEGMTFSAR